MDIQDEKQRLQGEMQIIANQLQRSQQQVAWCKTELDKRQGVFEYLTKMEQDVGTDKVPPLQDGEVADVPA